MPQSQFHDESRGSQREQVDIHSQIWGATIAPTPARIVNISPQGCMIRCDEMVPMGEHLTVDVPQLGALRGTVIWSLSARIGVQFDSAIAVESYLDLLDSLEGAPNGPPLL